jgi:hypothetical protein
MTFNFSQNKIFAEGKKLGPAFSPSPLGHIKLSAELLKHCPIGTVPILHFWFIYIIIFSFYYCSYMHFWGAGMCCPLLYWFRLMYCLSDCLDSNPGICYCIMAWLLHCRPFHFLGFPSYQLATYSTFSLATFSLISPPVPLLASGEAVLISSAEERLRTQH